MTLITEEYRLIQRQMHLDQHYGTASMFYAKTVARFMNHYGVVDLLDYGSGKNRLVDTMAKDRMVNHEFRYYAYEPSIEEFAETPTPHQMVACIDVLEHVEPDCLCAVLDDLKRCTLEIGLFTVATGPALRHLPDGRNAHLIQQPASWWLPAFFERFEVQTYQKAPDGFMVLVTPSATPARASILQGMH